MPVAYAYSRVSSRDQADSGLGLEAQRKQLTDYYHYALAATHTWGGIFEDAAVSGKKPLRSRPEGYQLNAKLEKGDVVVIAKLDRGFRSTPDALVTLETWVARGISVKLLDLNLDTATASGRLMLTILAAFAQFERDRMTERMIESHAVRRAKGFAAGYLPRYGYKFARVNGIKTLVPCPASREWGQLFLKWKREGLSVLRIWRHCLDQRLRNAQGREWGLITIHTMIKAELKLQAEEKQAAEQAAAASLEPKEPTDKK